MLLGLAMPGDTDAIPAGDLVRLSDATYRDRRAGRDGVGRAATSALLKVAEHVGPDAFVGSFPELAAATAAIGRLRDGELPEGFVEFDRVVVDEVQDLTLLETGVVVELCLAITRRRGNAPWLLAAGDDGQIVRPSGFDWGALNDLLAARLDAPRRFHLKGNLRCPSRIAAVIERASQWYVHLDKSRRPTKQRHQQGGQHIDAHLLHVVADVPTAVGLLEGLDEVEGPVVITVADEKPVWVPERLRDMVLTPADAKGLEYQSVCVLDPGRVLARLEAATGPMTTDPSQALREQEHRTAIDQLRVALSRVTETLAFVVAGDDDAHALSAELLEDAAPYHAGDLVENFADDAPPEERVQARTNDARGLIDTAPGRAWQRACQAMRLLGDPQLPNGVADESVRIEARTTLLATAARLLVDGVPAAVNRHEVVNMAGEPIMAARRVRPVRARAARAGCVDAGAADGALRAARRHARARLRRELAAAGAAAGGATAAGGRRDVRQRYDRGRCLRRRCRGLAEADRLRGRRRRDGPGAALPGRRYPDRWWGDAGRRAGPDGCQAAGPRTPGAAA